MKEITLQVHPVCLTFVDDFERDLPVIAVHVWGVANLADVSAVKGWWHLSQSDGGVPLQNITRPLNVA